MSSVISPGHAIEDFLSIVERMGLHKVSYNVGWTAWLDIAPHGVNKATALEWVRERLGRAALAGARDRRRPQRYRHAGSGHPSEGRGVAMGQAPDEVVEAASERTGTDLEDGVAQVLDAL